MPAKLPALELKWTSEFEEYLREEKNAGREHNKVLQKPLQKVSRGKRAKQEPTT